MVFCELLARAVVVASDRQEALALLHLLLHAPPHQWDAYDGAGSWLLSPGVVSWSCGSARRGHATAWHCLAGFGPLQRAQLPTRTSTCTASKPSHGYLSWAFTRSPTLPGGTR